MNALRKKWVVAADNLLRIISAREKDISRLKANNGNQGIIKRINEEVEDLISFYNETEEAFKTMEFETLNVNIKLILAKREIETLQAIVMDFEPPKGQEIEYVDRLMKAHKKN